jgi:hypothetical protein
MKMPAIALASSYVVNSRRFRVKTQVTFSGACRYGHNEGMGTDDKKKSKPEEEKKPPTPVRVPRKIGESPGNLRKREEWFRKRSGS